MGRIVAIAGGDLQSTKALNDYIVHMIDKPIRKFLFIGTASCDAEGYIDNIRSVFGKMNCEVKPLCLSQPITDHQIDTLLEWADIIYVGGGDTFYMMETWRKYGLEKKLYKIYLKDRAVLSGISAGAMCWFLCGHSDSEIFCNNDEVGYGWVDNMLDIHHFAYCPHYEDRKESFDSMLKQKNMVGLALESDTAFVEENGQINYIKCRESAKAYIVSYMNGVMEKKEVDVKMI